MAEIGITEFGPEYDFRAEELIVEFIKRSARSDGILLVRDVPAQAELRARRPRILLVAPVRRHARECDDVADILTTATGRVFMEPTDPKASTPAETRSSGGRDGPHV
jgi:hypothetical protein